MREYRGIKKKSHYKNIAKDSERMPERINIANIVNVNKYEDILTEIRKKYFSFLIYCHK
jgi:hypothetical protein